VRAHPLRLFADLIGKPVWLVGIAAMVSGQVLGALALGCQDAHVSLVEPLFTTNLFFALGLARSLSDERLRWRQWVGAVVLIAGIAVFLVAAQPSTGGGLSEVGMSESPRRFVVRLDCRRRADGPGRQPPAVPLVVDHRLRADDAHITIRAPNDTGSLATREPELPALPDRRACPIATHRIKTSAGSCTNTAAARASCAAGPGGAAHRPSPVPCT
jgi:hypothetical protein